MDLYLVASGVLLHERLGPVVPVEVMKAHHESKQHLPKDNMFSMPVWVNNYIHYKVWDEITYISPNSNDEAVE